jgi:SlyX protein
MQHLEEQIAHLTKTVDEMSAVVARQQTEIDRLTHRVQMLMEREAGREPPHY